MVGAGEEEYSLRKCCITRLLPATHAHTQTLSPTPHASQPMRAVGRASSMRGSGVRFETRSSAASEFSQFFKEAQRMAMEGGRGRVFSDLVDYVSVSRGDVRQVLSLLRCS